MDEERKQNLPITGYKALHALADVLQLSPNNSRVVIDIDINDAVRVYEVDYLTHGQAIELSKVLASLKCCNPAPFVHKAEDGTATVQREGPNSPCKETEV